MLIFSKEIKGDGRRKRITKRGKQEQKRKGKSYKETIYNEVQKREERYK